MFRGIQCIIFKTNDERASSWKGRLKLTKNSFLHLKKNLKLYKKKLHGKVMYLF